MIPSTRTTDYYQTWTENEIKNSDLSVPTDGEITQEASKRFIKLYYQKNDKNGLMGSWTDDSESFCRSMEPVFKVSRFFGLPDLASVGRNSRPTTGNVKLSKRIYSFFIFILLVMIFTRSLEFLIKTRMGMNNCTFNPRAGVFVGVAITVYYGVNIFEFLLFFWLPSKWMNLQKEWRAMEKQLKSFSQSRPKLRKKFMIIFCVLMIFGIIEYAWSIIWAFKTDNHYCDAWWDDKTVFNIFTTKNYTFTSIFFIILDIVLYASTLFTTFIWNFTDLFIILVATGLSEKYKFMNKSVMNTKMWENHDNYWHQLRINYSGLNKLVKEADKILSPFIFVSCAYNFFIICLLLFIGISVDNNANFSEISPIFSFFFVVVRTLAVMFSASGIHDQSKVIFPVIYGCPESKFTIETQRLETLMSDDDVALTAMNFFAIKRNFILAVAGSIVTYEIILLHLSTDSR